MGDNLSLTVKFATLDKLSPALRGMIGLSDRGTGALKKLKGEARDLDKRLADVRDRLKSATGNVSALVDEERSLAAALARTNAQYDRRKSDLARIGRADKLSRELRGKGQDNLVQGASIAAPLILAVREGMRFQDGMTDIRQKANLTAADTAKMAANIQRVAVSTAQLPENIRAGVDTLMGFGLGSGDSAAIIGPIARAGTAYRAEIADVAAASYAGISNLKVPIGDTAQMLDVMAAAGKAGAFELKDMAQYFPALASAAQGLNQKGVPAIADLAAAAQIARKGTGDAASAANNLQNLMAKINAKPTVERFAKFGVDLPAALKKAYRDGKTPIEAIAEITNKTLGGNLERMSYLFEDMQVQNALRPLIQNMDEYRRIRADALRAQGDVQRDFDMRAANGSAQWTRLMATGTRIGIVAGTTLLPVLNALADKLLVVGSAVADWADKNPELFGYLVQGVAYLAAFKIGLGALQLGLSMTVGPWARFIGIALKGKDVLGMLRLAFIFLGQGIMRAGAMMLANPVVLIITAIVVAIGLAAYLIYTHWDTIKAAFGAAWTYITGACARGWAFVKGVFLAHISFLVSLPSRFASFGQNLMQGLVNGIIAGASWVKNAIFGIAGKIGSWFRGALGIKSPSRVFMGFGDNIAAGLAIGIDKGSGRPMASMRRFTRGVTAAGALGLSGAAMAAGGAPAGAQGAGGGQTFHFYITQAAGEDSEALARRVADLVQKASRTAARSSYEDL